MVALSLSLVGGRESRLEERWVECRTQLAEIRHRVGIEHGGGVMRMQVSLLGGGWVHETIHWHIGH